MKVRYFCDGCGAAVGARAERCPSCGKFFAAVRCPSCGYQGKAHEFSAGCPVCGYLAEGAAKRPGAVPAPRRRERRLGRGLTRPAALAAGAALLAALILLVVMLLRS